MEVAMAYQHVLALTIPFTPYLGHVNIFSLDSCLTFQISFMHNFVSFTKGSCQPKIWTLTCYSDSSICINLIEIPLNKYHNHAVLIQSIQNILLKNTMVRVIHILHEDNQNSDFMTKFSASGNVDLLIHTPPPSGLSNILTLQGL